MYAEMTACLIIILSAIRVTEKLSNKILVKALFYKTMHLQKILVDVIDQ